METVSFEISKTDNDRIRKKLEETGFEFSEIAHALFKAKKKTTTVVVYKSNKIVISGEKVEVNEVLKLLDLLHKIKQMTEDTLSKTEFISHIGVDESGKGDFFGPLVVAGVYVDIDGLKFLQELKVRDSKKLIDGKVLELKNMLIKKIKYEVIAISPEKYNKLYSDFKNINKLLAWGHAKVIENLLKKEPKCKLAIIDQFAKSKNRVSDALQEEGKKIEVLQMHKGERDIAVASASIIARAVFLETLEALSKKYGLNFPKGVSQKVVDVGNQFIEKYGENSLQKVTKSNFKTYKLLNLS